MTFFTVFKKKNIFKVSQTKIYEYNYLFNITGLGDRMNSLLTYCYVFIWQYIT